MKEAAKIEVCCICRRRRRVAWWLGGYYGIGSQYDGVGLRTNHEPCCRQCMDSVTHDGYGRPRHPRRYARALKRYVENK